MGNIAKRSDPLSNKKVSNRPILAKLPNCEKAVVDTANKLLGYCLNMNHRDRKGNLAGGHHAKVFADVLGITADHAQLLTNTLLEVAKENDATLRETKNFPEDDGGMGTVTTYEIRFMMTGPSGRTAEVVSAWRTTNTDDTPFLTSCYVAKAKKDERNQTA